MMTYISPKPVAMLGLRTGRCLIMLLLPEMELACTARKIQSALIYQGYRRRNS